ncbi:DUF1707 SHOCT-like domain-containing protein [Flindersiella endophytica]
MAQGTRRPGTRVGDEERHKTAEILSEHHAHGRLTQEEFEDRLGAALTAQTTAELGRLLADLPLRHEVERQESALRPAVGELREKLGRATRRAGPTAVAVGGIGAMAVLTTAAMPYYGYSVFAYAFATGIIGLLGGRMSAWAARRRRAAEERRRSGGGTTGDDGPVAG